MEAEIRERYNDNILEEARERFGIQPESIRLLDGFESFMYEFEQDSESYILRISHSIRRTKEMYQGEVDWINYLVDGGVGAARAVPSKSGALVEVIEDGQGGQFLAVAFVKAKGGGIWEMGGWNEELFITYGRLLGRIHYLSKSYTPPDPSWRRLEWDDPINVDLFGWLPDDQQLIAQKGEAIIAYLQTLPKSNESYGLIHQDAHVGNFFVDDQGNITLFDFDDSCYGWFVYDIAMVIFYAVTNHENPKAMAEELWSPFWRGYCQENDLDSKWLANIPAFLKLREIDLFAIIYRSFDVDNLQDGWVGQFMDGRKDRIQQDVPYLDFEFKAG